MILRPEHLQIEAGASDHLAGLDTNGIRPSVRVTHAPTGLQVYSAARRSQEANQQLACSMLEHGLREMGWPKDQPPVPLTPPQSESEHLAAILEDRHPDLTLNEIAALDPDWHDQHGRGHAGKYSVVLCGKDECNYHGCGPTPNAAILDAVKKYLVVPEGTAGSPRQYTLTLGDRRQPEDPAIALVKKRLGILAALPLSEWQQSFVDSCIKQGGRLSVKQKVVFDRIWTQKQG